jgi:hypothetical protein
MKRFVARALRVALFAIVANATAESATPSSSTPVDGAGLDGVSTPDAIDGIGTNRYLRIAGSNFVPRHAVTDAIFAGAGCIRASVAGAIFTADLQLPSGAVVNYVRTYYYNDGVSAGISTHLTDFDGTGGSVQHTDFTTSTGTGYASTLSPPVSLTITPMTHSYSMVVVINSTSTDLRFCGVRIQYTP